MLNILVLYDIHTVMTNTVHEHLSSFQLYSKHKVYYAHATHAQECNIDLSYFDVIVLHYSVRMAYNWHLSPHFSRALQDYKGFQVVFTQDEYDLTENARNWFEKLGINLVYTCVPPEYVDLVYPSKRFPNIKFKQNLTGYVPIHHERFRSYIKPIRERECYIAYRSRNLPFWYGDLGQEKSAIAKGVKALCEQHSIQVDIEYEESQRIYGDNWYRFLAKSKATLGTESGANVFDDHGHIRESIKAELEKNPDITYEEVSEKYLKGHDGIVRMNQVSPRIFESILFRSALILFEGTYSGVVLPNLHFIPLKKDFSNFDEVRTKLLDDDYLQQMVDRAYQDVIESEKYSYQNFIRAFDETLESSMIIPKQNRWIPIKYESFEDNVKAKGILQPESPLGLFTPQVSETDIPLSWQNLKKNLQKNTNQMILNVEA